MSWQLFWQIVVLVILVTICTIAVIGSAQKTGDSKGRPL
jgi:F0F1-type ATP synthase membrane subunit b/b'